MYNNELQRLHRILEATAEGWWEWDIEQDATYRSPHWYEMLGLPVRQEPNSINFWLQHIHPDDKEYALQYQEQCIKSDLRWESDFRMRHTQGHYLYIRSRGRVLKRDAETGAPLLAAGTHADITQQKQLEGRLKEQLRFLDDLSYQNSHHFRSAVANIMGILQLLREDAILWENVTIFKHLETTVGRLDEAVQELNDKIEQFLNPDKLEDNHG